MSALFAARVPSLNWFVMSPRKLWTIVLAILVVAAGFRISVAHWLPNDGPDDGRVYAQMARNLLEQHVFSHAPEAPYSPSLIRLPGYPLFLAGVYSIFGHTNNGAARIAQALIDTATCGLIALLAYYWQPDEKRKRTSAIAALALAAVCPFTTIYAATILTEVWTNFLMMATFVAVTISLRGMFTTEDTEEERARKFRRALMWWVVAGLLAGLNVFFRPDSGLFAAAVGLTLVIAAIWSVARGRSGPSFREKETNPERHRPFALPQSKLSRAVVAGAVFSIAFAVVLAPWTIRNWRVFHQFQPLAPRHGEMPGEFVPRGYQLWVRSWLDDDSYVAPFLWALDTDPIDIDDVPPSAFDSAAEKDRVAALLDKYNNPDSETVSVTSAPPQPTPTPPPSPSASASSPKAKTASPSPAQKNSNSNKAETSDEENDNSDEGDQNDESDQDKDESDNSATEPHGAVEMTPEIDAGFAQLAGERIARHRFQFYVWLPIKRARTMWFDTHSQYWPFEGTLLPFEDLDYEHHQQYWLPLFAGLTALYTLLGLAGGWVLWVSGKFEARTWLLLTMLAIGLRLILFSSLENPEPRYVVEFFPLLAVLGGIAIGLIKPRINADSR